MRKMVKDENKKIYTVCRDRWFSGTVFWMRTKDRQRATSQAVSEQADTKENAETSGAAGAETEKETAPTVQVVTDDMVPVEADALKDGVYPVEVDSSSSMFHITEAELTVADGKMSAKLTLSGSGYGKVFMGTGEEAEKAGKEITFRQKRVQMERMYLRSR